MKTKILMITVALAVMMAFTGIAGATGILVVPDPVTVNPNTYTSHDVKVTSTLNKPVDSLEIAYVIKPGGLIMEPITNYFDVKIDSVVTTSVSDGGSASPRTYVVEYKLKNGAPVGTYTVQYKATDTDTGVSEGHYDVPATLNAIPEFPTVALPIAAVIGLVFLLGNRKNKEE